MGLRTLRPDLRNHVTALQGLLEQGKHTELSRYLADLAGSPTLDSGKRYAKNEIANVVLCSKTAQMEELALMPDFEVSLPESLVLSDIDLCATKKDSTQHGYGLAGMREIAMRHGGSLEAEAKNYRFELLVCFPCKG